MDKAKDITLSKIGSFGRSIFVAKFVAINLEYKKKYYICR